MGKNIPFSIISLASAYTSLYTDPVEKSAAKQQLVDIARYIAGILEPADKEFFSPMGSPFNPVFVELLYEKTASQN